MFKKIVWLWFSSKWKNAKEVWSYIESLVEAWAEEFMTWYNPSYWFEKFGFEVSPNGRFAEHEQITDYETLKQIVEKVHEHKLEIFVNLNAWYYTNETFPLIKKMVSEIIEIWFDWIICWNISILEYLKEINYTKKINLSTILSLYNKESIRFFIENYKINKVILSREVTLKEIEDIVSEFPDIQFEVFWEWDFCRYNNWLCFAEHKYWAKDICTVVVNDLVIKKRFKPDYKKIILEKTWSNIYKTELLNDNYKNEFESIKEIIEHIEVWLEDKKRWLETIYSMIEKVQNRIDLYYDSLKNIDSEDNKKILIVLKWINYLIYNNYDSWNKEKLIKLKNELEKSVKTWIAYNLEQEQDLWWKNRIKAMETASFYWKNDILNMYSYLFFDKFKNIVTVKFPTRWRSSVEKLKIIKETINKWEVDSTLLNRSMSLKRTHYDLTHIFSDKLWFRKLLNKI